MINKCGISPLILSRLIYVTETTLRIIAQAFENNEDLWYETKLVGIHCVQLISVIEKIAGFKSKVKNSVHFTTECLHETSDVIKQIIKRKTEFPVLEKYGMIYSGPHIEINNPIYQSPREKCVLKIRL
jgi:hypothetical protein